MSEHYCAGYNNNNNNSKSKNKVALALAGTVAEISPSGDGIKLSAVGMTPAHTESANLVRADDADNCDITRSLKELV